LRKCLVHFAWEHDVFPVCRDQAEPKSVAFPDVSSICLVLICARFSSRASIFSLPAISRSASSVQ
jgi:hypothetical protein